MKYNSDLKPDKFERLAILSEECGEVIQEIGKTFRHGTESFNPFDSEKLTNKDKLEKELGDVLCIMKIMKDSGDIDMDRVMEYSEKKTKKITKWLHHQNLKAYQIKPKDLLK